MGAALRRAPGAWPGLALVPGLGVAGSRTAARARHAGGLSNFLAVLAAAVGSSIPGPASAIPFLDRGW